MGNKGTLFIVATPIGNLEDITIRALKVLEQVDIIAAEDTRHTIKLLNHFNIKTQLISYHEHNTIQSSKKILSYLDNGKDVALVSDAGMPIISDPGEQLVKFISENNINITCIPGASASLTALALSGLKSTKFVFEGFLPNTSSERRKYLDSLNEEIRTIIFYESPHRLISMLKDLLSILGNRNISICRELTKKYEQVQRITVEQAIEYFSQNQPKGEFVLVVEGIDEKFLKEQSIKEWESLSISEHMEYYMQQGIEKKEAMKKVAKDRGITKRDVYKKLLE